MLSLSGDSPWAFLVIGAALLVVGMLAAEASCLLMAGLFLIIGLMKGFNKLRRWWARRAEATQERKATLAAAALAMVALGTTVAAPATTASPGASPVAVVVPGSLPREREATREGPAEIGSDRRAAPRTGSSQESPGCAELRARAPAVCSAAHEGSACQGIVTVLRQSCMAKDEGDRDASSTGRR